MSVSRDEFLSRRRTGIGGSDVAAILGLSKWKTPRQLWEEKTGRAQPREETDLLRFGLLLEDAVALEFSRRNGVRIQRRNEMYRHRDHECLIANIDRKIVGRDAVLECKTADKFTRHLWGDDGSDEVPEYYLTQVMHYMHVTGYHESMLAVLIGGNEYRQFEIGYVRDVAEFCAAKCVEFWQMYVVRDVAPPPQMGDDLSRIYLPEAGKSIAASDEIAGAVAELKEKKRAIKELESQADELSFAIKNFMGDAEILSSGSEKLATWKKDKDAEKIYVNWDAVAAECNVPAEVITKHTTIDIKTGARKLLLKQRND